MAKEKRIVSCPVGESLGVFAGKWKPEILWYIKEEPMRFNQLQRAIGSVSQKMLTQQLRELQRDGLVKRTQYNEIPPRVEYAPTVLADSLRPLFELIVKWRDDYDTAVRKARRKYDLSQKKVKM